MLKLFILTLFALSGGFALQTPETSYYLVEPSIDVYLDAVPEIIERAEANGISQFSVRLLIDTEFTKRFPNPLEASHNRLFSAFQSLVRASSPYAFYLQLPRWNEWLILNWIEENDIDLDTVDHFEYENYAVTVTPRDFNVDGEPEWVLDVRSIGFTQIVVIRQEGEAYQRVRTPLLWFGSGFAYTSISSGVMEEKLYDDLNGDGLPEWVLAVGGYGGNNMSGGHLTILNWRDGELVDVAPPQVVNGLPAGDTAIQYDAPAGSGQFVFPYGVSIDYVDDDSDGTRDILIHQEQHDNWGCTWTQLRAFGWQEDTYTLMRSERVWNDVRGCEIRAAETAMWARDYQGAIPHYERAFTLPVPQIRYAAYEVLDRYATARLALAYTLAGQYDDATAVSGSLSVLPDERSALVTFIPAITEHLGDARAMCLAAYDAFSFECPPETDACSGSPIRDLTIGTTLENPGDFPDSARNGFPPASSAGCDPMILLRDDLLAAPLTVDRSPVDQLEARGYAVQNAMSLDLNLDGAHEWLIDLELDRRTIFVQPVSNTDRYDVAFISLPRGVRSVHLLPDNSGQTLIVAGYDFITCPPISNGRGGRSHPTARTVALWVLNEDTLQERQRFPFCNRSERPHDVLPGSDGEPLPDEFAGWIDLPYPEEELALAVYQWDSVLGEYVATDIVTTPPLPESRSGSPFSWAVDAIQSGDYEQAQTFLDQALRQAPEDVNTVWGVGYLRAFTLEMQDHPGEALEGYVAIYEDAPTDSAWRTLAGLHLEASP